MKVSVLRVAGGALLAGSVMLLVSSPRSARGSGSTNCPAPRPGVARWNEAGPVNAHRNLRVPLDIGGVPLVYDSATSTTASPYGGNGWALAIGRAEISGDTVVIDEGGARATFTRSGAGYASEAFDLRTLVQTGPTTYELRGDVGAARVFEGGLETTIRDAHGIARTYSYDASGRLSQIADPRSGESIALAYANGRLSTVTRASTGRTETLGYDYQQRLASVIAGTAYLSQFAYDGDGHISSTTNRAGEQTQYLYSSDGGLETIRLPDSLAVRTSCELDDSNRLVMRTTDSFGDSVAQAFDAGGSVVATFDPYGNATTYERDASQRVLSVTADGRSTRYEWTAANDVASITADGHTSTFTYDSAHRIVRGQDALGRATTTTYDAAGNVTDTVDAFGRATHVDRNASGDALSVRTADGLVTSYAYDALGHVTSETAPDGKTTTYSYGAQGDLVGAAYPDGTSESWTVDRDGSVLSHTDRRGETSAVAYDGERRPSTVSLPNGRGIDLAYDTAGRVTQRALRLGPTPKSDARSYGLYGEVATESLNGVLSQSAPRTHVPLQIPMVGAGSGSGSGGGRTTTTVGAGSGI